MSPLTPRLFTQRSEGALGYSESVRPFAGGLNTDFLQFLSELRSLQLLQTLVPTLQDKGRLNGEDVFVPSTLCHYPR